MRNNILQRIGRLLFGLEYPPGHFYSSVPDRRYVMDKADRIFSVPESIEGIDLNTDSQLSLLKQLKNYYGDVPFPEKKDPGFRYYYDNRFYSYGSAVYLYCMMRHFKPKRIVEAGNGFSSALMMDVSDIYFDGNIDFTFIDPDHSRLHSLMRKSDALKIEIVNQDIQDVGLSVFSSLTENDILFIDSSHVSKTGSDVNHIIFEVLPRLKEGVLIHIHDIFYPFEYPKQWILSGKDWNENYLLRAFLTNNSAFRIILFNSYLEHFYRDWFDENMPLPLKRPGGSIWLRKER